VLVFGLVNFRGAINASISTAGEMRVEDFADNKVVSEWLKTCEAQGEGTYVLAYEIEVSLGQREQSYIIYHLNGETSYAEPWVMVTPKKLFKKATIVVGYQADPAGTEDYLLQQVEYFGEQADLEIYEEGQKVNYYLEETDTPITFAEINRLNDNATNLYAARMEYLGDNSGVISLIDETGLSGIGPYTIELETEKTPYGLRIIFDSVPKDFEMVDFSTYAIELLGLIKNLDYVEITDGENTYTLTAEKATQTLGFDIKELGQSQEKLEDYLRSLQESIND